AEDKGRRKFRFDTKERERTDLYSQAWLQALEPRQIFRKPEPGECMQTGIGDLKGETVSEESVEQLDEDRAPLGINFSHSPNVAEIKPFVDEASEGRLIDRRRMLVNSRPKFRDGVGQRRRDKKISQAQRGIENLAHGA